MTINLSSVRDTKAATYGQEVWTPPGTLILRALQEPEEKFNSSQFGAALAWRGDEATSGSNATHYNALMDAAVEVAMSRFKLSEDEAREALAKEDIRPPIRKNKDGDGLVMFTAAKKKGKDDNGKEIVLPVPCFTKTPDGKTERVAQEKIDETIEPFCVASLRVEIYATNMGGKMVNARLIGVVRVADPQPYEAKADNVSDDELGTVPDYSPTTPTREPGEDDDEGWN